MTRVLLVGLPASGKSTVADAIASVAGWPRLDGDALIERTTGSTVRELVDAHGAERLRAAETNVLTLVLSMPGPYVACLAPGSVRDSRDRERLRSAGHVVWTRAPLATLVRRVARAGAGARLEGDAEVALREMAQECEPLYAEVAHQVLEMERLSPATAAREVVAALRRE